MLRAIPIKSGQPHQREPLHHPVVACNDQPAGERLLDRHIAQVAEQLEAPAVRVIHEEQRHAIVGDDVAGGHELLIAAEVGPAERLIVEHAHEALGSAAELKIGHPVSDTDAT